MRLSEVEFMNMAPKDRFEYLCQTQPPVPKYRKNKVQTKEKPNLYKVNSTEDFSKTIRGKLLDLRRDRGWLSGQIFISEPQISKKLKSGKWSAKEMIDICKCMGIKLEIN